MKLIKSFMLLAVALSFFASCSEDDDATNTMECTVGFENSAVTIDETAGIVNIPIAVNGHRNGPVRVTIETAPTGTENAVEGTHYMVTDKTLNLNPDTLSTGTINVEVKVIDDREINADRQFTLTITSAEGAEITTRQTTVTISDNDGDFYRAFAGTWIINAKEPATDEDGYVVGEQNYTATVEITAASENDPDYEKYLSASSVGMFNIGVSVDCAWRFHYTFDANTMQGTLGFVLGDVIASYGGIYNWTWGTDAPDGQNITFQGEVNTIWEPSEEGGIPNTITFPENATLYLLDPNYGWFSAIYNITMTRE